MRRDTVGMRGDICSRRSESQPRIQSNRPSGPGRNWLTVSKS